MASDLRSSSLRAAPECSSYTLCVISLKVLKCFCFSLQSRIKKIMQKDAEVGRIAMAVPVIICIILHLFI